MIVTHGVSYHRKRVVPIALALIAAIALAPTAFCQQLAKFPAPLTGPIPNPITPPSSAELEGAIVRGVTFLLKNQNKDGSWGSAHRTKDLNIYAPVPGAHYGLRAAVTALAITALIESEDPREEVQASLDRAQEWLLANLSRVKRSNGDMLYNVWTHGYALPSLVQLAERLPADAEEQDQIARLIEEQVELLQRYASIDGGWGYYDFRTRTKRPGASSSCFTTAAILVAVHEAQAAGAEVPQEMIDQAYHSIQRQRTPDFCYLYGESHKYRPMAPINRPPGSLGRSQACNIATRLHGDELVTDDVLKTWLNRLYSRNDWLGFGRKTPIPHESFAQVAGYFYYFGHYYAARCIEVLPADEQPYFQDHLAHIIIPLQEKNGCWWDYPLYNYHETYGTALAISTLVRCRQAE